MNKDWVKKNFIIDKGKKERWYSNIVMQNKLSVKKGYGTENGNN